MITSYTWWPGWQLGPTEPSGTFLAFPVSGLAVWETNKATASIGSHPCPSRGPSCVGRNSLYFSRMAIQISECLCYYFYWSLGVSLWPEIRNPIWLGANLASKARSIDTTAENQADTNLIRVDHTHLERYHGPPLPCSHLVQLSTASVLQLRWEGG